MKEIEIGPRLMAAIAVIAVSWGLVRGCERTYDPESLRADAEATATRWKIGKPDPSPVPSNPADYICPSPGSCYEIVPATRK